MRVVESWTVESKDIEILHECGRAGEAGRWEYRVDGDVKMYGRGTPQEAREAISTRRKLRYRG